MSLRIIPPLLALLYFVRVPLSGNEYIFPLSSVDMPFPFRTIQPIAHWTLIALLLRPHKLRGLTSIRTDNAGQVFGTTSVRELSWYNSSTTFCVRYFLSINSPICLFVYFNTLLGSSCNPLSLLFYFVFYVREYWLFYCIFHNGSLICFSKFYQ